MTRKEFLEYKTVCKLCGKFIKYAPFCWENHIKICNKRYEDNEEGFVFVDWQSLSGGTNEK